MKILIDGRALQTYSGLRGIGRYVNQLIDIFGKDPEFTFLFFKKGYIPDRINKKILINSPKKAITFSDRFVIPRILKRGDFDIYHSTAYALPEKIEGVKYFITFYDLTPLKFPEFSSKKNKYIFKKIIGSMKNADKIISISHNSKVDLLKYTNLGEEKIDVIHNYAEQFPVTKTEIEIPYKENSYSFYLGGTDGNKNLSTLIRSVGKTNIPLVISGHVEKRRETQLRGLLGPGKRDLLYFTGFVSDSELISLFSDARIFLFPSLYEGFGYPPLEALLYGTPSVVSCRGSLPEILGDAALYCDDPLNINSLSEKIETLWKSEKIRKDLIEKGKKVLKKLSKSVFEKKMRELYS